MRNKNVAARPTLSQITVKMMTTKNNNWLKNTTTNINNMWDTVQVSVATVEMLSTSLVRTKKWVKEILLDI